MLLTDGQIEEYLDEGRIVIDPRPASEFINGISLDLRLGRQFQVHRNYQAPYLDISGPKAEIQKQIAGVMGNMTEPAEGEAFYLQPGELALGATLETVTLPDDVVGSINGRSSLGRLGLMVHVTAHIVDPGWNGPLVLEFYNAGNLPLALRPGMRICAISFTQLDRPALRPYNKRANAKYADQRGTVGSRIDRDEER